jgi:CDP-4-dehydro-6-deoxyglucose reductase, E1
MNWPLNASNFTLLDRLKIAHFFLKKKNFWTMTEEVEKFESLMKDYVGCKHAVFVSSGSTANTMLAMYVKDKIYTKSKNIIVFPSTTWITSVSPFIREGFKPHFIDIDPVNLSINTNELEVYLMTNHKKVACVFVTSLLGFSPNIDKLIELERKYKVRIMLDNCESTFTKFKYRNISSYFTSTTSTYFGHQLQSVEGGFVFTNSDEEYEYFLMARNHGMIRGLKFNHKKYRNTDVDSRFDFNILGNNFRNTNINAFIGQLDFKRIKNYIQARRKIYSMFDALGKELSFLRVIRMNNDTRYDVPFSVPLIFTSSTIKDKVESFCSENNIETRPIISGNLLRQTCLKGLYNPSHFTVSEWVHRNGFYVGLHSKVRLKDVQKLVNFIKSLKHRYK